MDGYPAASVAHSLPLLSILGLGLARNDAAVGPEDSGIQIFSDIPAVETEEAQLLVRYLKDCDASNVAWSKREHEGRSRFRVKICGREYHLPSRQVASSASSAKSIESQSNSPNSKPVLHSPLSPLSLESSVFPDGLLDPKWLEKHQDVVPSAFISFYSFTQDMKLATLRDNQIKSDINGLRKALAQAGVRSRIIVVLLSEEPYGRASDVGERLENMRRATGLDLKTSLFITPRPSSPGELKSFVTFLLTTIYPSCIEYYRDLSKHTRRKKNRSIIPPPTVRPTSTSQTLSTQGWNVRYDFKLGVFAEFRQEMDAAVRSYESSYDALLGPEVLETIVNWSPRWNEARLLSDVLAMRILRCLLWTGSPTAAVRRWQLHRDKIRDFVDRRGKGSLTYGWEAWEARWAIVMAETIQRVALSEFSPPQCAVFLPMEKMVPMGERIQPWEHLHHPGYYFCMASKHLVARRTLALAIPEEDRSPPGSSPASQIASKAYTYDTYLCPEPHLEATQTDHGVLITDTLFKAATEYKSRGQRRQLDELQILIAKENVRRKAWDNALQILRPLWRTMKYRAEGWLSVVEDIGWALRNVAAATGDGQSIISIDWELLHKDFTQRQGWHYDLSRSLEGVNVEVKPKVVLLDHDIHSFLSAAFSFEQSAAKVGEPCRSQLSVASAALPFSAVIKIAEVRIDFEGGMKSIILRHKDDETQGREKNPLRRVPLLDGLHRTTEDQPGEDREPLHSLIGDTDLGLSPAQSKVFEFASIPKEPGRAKAVLATFSIASDAFDLKYIHNLEIPYARGVWWTGSYSKKKIIRESASSISILPKPPKIELRFAKHEPHHYTNEDIRLRLEVINREDVGSIVNLSAEGRDAPPIHLRLADASGDDRNSGRLDLGLGTLASGSVTAVDVYIKAVDIPSTYEIEIISTYSLISDLDINLSVSALHRLEVVDPFEANYEFAPRIHLDPFASFFVYDEPEDDARPQGLAQSWCLIARYASFATNELVVEDIKVEIIDVNGGVRCSTKRLITFPSGGLVVKPRDFEEVQFEILSQKLSLDDRAISMLDCCLAISWRRNIPDSPLHIMKLAVPRLLASNSEPRVLASVSHSTTIQSVVHFDITVENPSSHFLTFSLTMEPSENFAFSGVRQSVLQLVPLSRRTMRFRLLPCIVGHWIGPVNCVIRDRYFQKVLKVIPMEGMKLEKEGIFIWVPPLVEED